jgi:hypothetical protein
MPATFSTAKIYVARTIGGQNDTDQLNAAGDAIKEAIEEWNLRRNWNYLLMDNSDDPIDLVAGTSTYTLPSTIKEQYTARLLSNTRTLEWVDQRYVDRIVRNQTVTGTPTHYTIFNGSTAFGASALSSQVGRIKLIPTPINSASNELLVRYYRTIESPSADVSYIDTPDRFLFAMLARAKYYFMVNKDAESGRTAHHFDWSEKLFMKVVADDENYEERDVRLIPQVESGQAFGPSLSGYPDMFWIP